MELLQLKYFCTAAECQNFTKTAEKFTVPPSAVSQSIRRLENELGTPLFDRSANRLYLNADGARFYESVAAALTLLNTAKEQLREEPPVKSLDICVNCNRRIVMQAVEKFKIEYPNAAVRTVHFGDCTSEYDLVITSTPSNFPTYSCEELLKEPLALAVHHAHPLANNGPLSPSCLADEAFVSLRQGSDFFKMTEQICKEAGFYPRIAVETDDPFYLRRCVEIGLGVSFVPLFSWQGQFSEEVSLLPLTGYTRTTYICTPRGRTQVPHVLRFTEILKNQIQNAENLA